MIADGVVDTGALLSELLASLGLAEPPAGEVGITGRDPIWAAKYPVGEAAAVVLAAIGVAVNDLWELRTGRRQEIRANVRRAAASLRGHYFQLLNGEETPRPVFPELAYSNHYQCRDGRWIQLHGGFPHLGEGTSKVIGSEHTAESIAAAVARWDSQALEDALAEVGMCGVIARSGEEWRATEQGRPVRSVAAPWPSMALTCCTLPGRSCPASGPTCWRRTRASCRRILTLMSLTMPIACSGCWERPTSSCRASGVGRWSGAALG